MLLVICCHSNIFAPFVCISSITRAVALVVASANIEQDGYEEQIYQTPYNVDFVDPCCFILV